MTILGISVPGDTVLHGSSSVVPLGTWSVGQAGEHLPPSQLFTETPALPASSPSQLSWI